MQGKARTPALNSSAVKQTKFGPKPAKYIFAIENRVYKGDVTRSDCQ
jgi:hypothetical protein